MAVKKPLCNYAGDIKELVSGDTVQGSASSGANTDITSITALTGAIELNGKYRIAYNAETNSLDITYIGV
jgi:hypothetical protein